MSKTVLMNDYRTIVVGTDGSDLSGPTVARAAWLAAREDAELVIVCAWSSISRRAEAKNVNAWAMTRPRSGRCTAGRPPPRPCRRACRSPGPTARP